MAFNSRFMHKFKGLRLVGGGHDSLQVWMLFDDGVDICVIRDSSNGAVNNTVENDYLADIIDKRFNDDLRAEINRLRDKRDMLTRTLEGLERELNPIFMTASEIVRRMKVGEDYPGKLTPVSRHSRMPNECEKCGYQHVDTATCPRGK